MTTAAAGNFFEDFTVGLRLHHATPRTVELADQSLYIALTGSRSPVHSSEPLARRVGLQGRPLEDLLVFNIAFGKTVPDISQNAVANLGYADLRFHRPVYAGDTLDVSSEVIGLRALSSGRAGIVYVRSLACDQHGRDVLGWVRWVMVHVADRSRPLPAACVPRLPGAVAADELPVWDGWHDVAAIAQATNSPRFWEDYRPGQRLDHPAGMTINDSDHSLATRLYQNTGRAHFDAAMMAAQPQGRRLVYGGHVISLCKALSYDGLENVLGWVAINGGRHVSPTFAGDTIRCATQVVDRFETRHPGLGALRLRTVGAKCGSVGDIGFPADESGHAGPSGVVLDIDYTVVLPRRP